MYDYIFSKYPSPRDRPKAPKQSGQEPLCHASDPELKKEYKKSWRTFMDQFGSDDFLTMYFAVRTGCTLGQLAAHVN